MDDVRGKTDDGKWKDNARRIVVEDQRYSDGYFINDQFINNQLAIAFSVKDKTIPFS